MKIATISYKSKSLADGSRPLMMRINQLKSKKCLSTGLSCPAEWWDFQKNGPKRDHLDRKLPEAIITQKKAAYHTKLLELESEQKLLPIQQLVQAEKSKQSVQVLFNSSTEVFNSMVERSKIGRARLFYCCQ